MKLLAAIAWFWAVAAAAAGPQPEVHTGTNTNPEIAHTHYAAPAGDVGPLDVRPTDAALAIGYDKNVTLKATRSSLRPALAFAFYRRANAPSGAARVGVSH